MHSRHVWSKMHKLCKTSHHKKSYASLWKNPEICIDKTGVFWKQWQLKGVTVIGDLYDDGIFMSYSELVKKYIIFLDKDIFGSICRSDTVLRSNASDNPVYAYLTLPCEIQTTSMCYKWMLNVTADTCNNLKTIWQKDLWINIHDNDWLDILSNVGKNIREARGKFIHYKIVHRYY